MKKSSGILIGFLFGVSTIIVIFLTQTITRTTVLKPGGTEIIIRSNSTRFEDIKTKIVNSRLALNIIKPIDDIVVFPIMRLLDTIYRVTTGQVQKYEPEVGGSCVNMQKYFNTNFGRSDTRFSNYEGQVQRGFFDQVYCEGGVIIQTFPTGKKTCTGLIQYNIEKKELNWETDNVIASCFVSQ